MWIHRDFLDDFDVKLLLEAVLIRGPRQIGKSSLLSKLAPESQSELYLDDVALRTQALEQPDFLLSEVKLPVLVDEVQLAPPIFSAIKKVIDEGRRRRLKSGEAITPAAYRLTGSNQLLLDQNVKESLAGRVSQFYLHGLSVAELRRMDPGTRLSEILLRGGFPELWIRPELNPVQYMNDYITTFIERDIARVAGIEKLNEFLKVLRLLAARTGELLQFESIGNDAGVAGKTVKEWIQLLERNQVVFVLPPYASNLNKRLIKMPKVYFYDLGICVRLQGHQDAETLLYSALGGHLFETLVVSEVVKTKLNFRKDWELSFWRTKEKEEIDLVIESDREIVLLEAKINARANVSLPKIPEIFNRTHKSIRQGVVTAQGIRSQWGSGWECVPLGGLRDFLISGRA